MKRNTGHYPESLDSPEVRFALEAVRQASLMVKIVQSEMVSPALTKADRSPVTVADFASQALIGYLLNKSFPNDPLVGEEDSSPLKQPGEGATLESVVHFVKEFIPEAEPVTVCSWIDRGNGIPGKRFWTLDPIDGTKGFLRGNQYAVALALLVDAKVQIGVLGCPNLVNGYQPDLEGSGSLVIAVFGEGTWTCPLQGDGTNYKQLHVSDLDDPSHARLLRSFESGHTNVGEVEQLVDELGIQAEPVRMDSQAKYSLLAAGASELYLRLLSTEKPNYREKIWDQAAGSLLVEEAGGRVSDLSGNFLDFSAGRTLAHNRGVCASNGHLHAAVLRALESIGG